MGLATKRRAAHLFYGLFYLLFYLQTCLSDKLTIDLESFQCTHMEPFHITNTDLISIIARPRFDISTRTSCIIRLKAPPHRHFNIYLHDIYIADCGVRLDFYDRDVHMKNPFKTFGCHSSPGALFNSYSNSLIVKLNKMSSAATRYRLRIELALDNGPKIGTNVDPNRATKQSLTVMTMCAALLISWLI